MVETGVSISPGLDSIPGRDRRTDRRTDRIPIANTRSQQYWPVQLSRVIKTQLTGVMMRFGESRVILAQCDSNDDRSDYYIQRHVVTHACAHADTC